MALVSAGPPQTSSATGLIPSALPPGATLQPHHVPSGSGSALGPAFKQARMHVYQAAAPVQLHRSQSDAAQLPHGLYGGHASQSSLATLRKDVPRKQSAYPPSQDGGGRTGSIGAAKKN